MANHDDRENKMAHRNNRRFAASVFAVRPFAGAPLDIWRMHDDTDNVQDTDQRGWAT